MLWSDPLKGPLSQCLGNINWSLGCFLLLMFPTCKQGNPSLLLPFLSSSSFLLFCTYFTTLKKLWSTNLFSLASVWTSVEDAMELLSTTFSTTYENKEHFEENKKNLPLVLEFWLLVNWTNEFKSGQINIASLQKEEDDY